jgi:uncharacterized membrane protein YedE/YeeE
MSVILASWNEFGSVPSLSILWKILKSVDASSSLKVWSSSSVNQSSLGIFFFGRLFIAASILLHVIDLFR